MKFGIKHLVYLVLVAVSVALAAGCNTAHGFGQDVESAGQSIQRKTE